MAAAAAPPKPIVFVSSVNTYTVISRSSLPRPPLRRSSVTTYRCSDRRVLPATAATLRPGGAHVAKSLRMLTPIRAGAWTPAAAASEGMSDPELRLVLELATDEELMEIEEILYGTSYFSPLLKSVAKRPNSDSIVMLDDIEERDMFISKLESRFLYLAADARSVIRGWRPSYRDVLLGVRRKLRVQCPTKLCTADLEAEIFLHLNEYSSDNKKGDASFPSGKQKSSKENSSFAVNNLKTVTVTDAAWRIGVKGLESAFLKGGSALTAKTIYESLL